MASLASASSRSSFSRVLLLLAAWAFGCAAVPPTSTEYVAEFLQVSNRQYAEGLELGRATVPWFLGREVDLDELLRMEEAMRVHREEEWERLRAIPPPSEECRVFREVYFGQPDTSEVTDLLYGAIRESNPASQEEIARLVEQLQQARGRLNEEELQRRFAAAAESCGFDWLAGIQQGREEARRQADG